MATLNLPTISSKVTPTEVKDSLDRLRIFFNSLGTSGGVASISDIGDIANLPIGGITEVVNGTIDLTVPPAVTGLSVSGAFNSIILTWTKQTYSNHGYVEVYRATVDDLGVAVYVGESSATVFTDTPPDASLSTTYYYWVRNVSQAQIPGPYNDSSGTPGTTADEPEYLLELITDSKWKAETARAIDFIGYPAKPNGYAYKVTTAGISGTTEPLWPKTLTNTVTDGTIVWTCEAELPLVPPFEIGLVNGIVSTVIKALLIGDATITNAMIKNLSADKINTGTLAASIIAAGSLDASKITAGTITAAQIAASTITAAQIAASTITAAQIASRTITADKITADTLTVTEIWGLARINGNRLGILGSGSVNFSNQSAFTITHGLGRLAVVSFTASWVAVDVFGSGGNSYVFVNQCFISSQDTNSFTLSIGSGMVVDITISYVYM